MAHFRLVYCPSFTQPCISVHLTGEVPQDLLDTCSWGILAGLGWRKPRWWEFWRWAEQRPPFALECTPVAMEHQLRPGDRFLAVVYRMLNNNNLLQVEVIKFGKGD